ncbi:MAG: pyridoxamine 5'-phosphate oxidase family protein [bacterium]|nr:pyridoxamine 5'-phosphate oxidase family protein [bacterium]
MSNTLIFYEKEEESESIGKVIGSIVINTKKMPINEEADSFSNYKNMIVITTYHNARTSIEKIKNNVSLHSRLSNLILVLTGEKKKEQQEDFQPLLREINKEAHIKVIFIEAQENVPQIAAKLAEQINQPEKAMPKDELLEEVEAFLKKHNTCGLATGAGSFVRCTPIEYEYINGALYIITEGGNKFVGILQNPNVSVVVFEPYTTMAELNGLQIMGTAKLVEANSKEYIEAFHRKGIQEETLSKLPIDMNVVKISPVSYEFLSSSFRTKGYDTKQKCSFE